jgi:hypothetical protein
MVALKMSCDLTEWHAHGSAWAWKTRAIMATPSSGHGALWFTISAIFLTGIVLPSRSVAQSPGWEYQPYRVHCIIALDLPGGVGDQITAALPTYLNRRAVAAIGPLWSLKVEIATGPMRQQILSRINQFNDVPPKDFSVANIDKLVLIAIQWTPDGYSLVAREFDTLVERWSVPIRRDSRQQDGLEEQAFSILTGAVAPVAYFDLAPDDESRVVLAPRGSALLRTGTGEAWTKPGDNFLPILRRTTRGGKLAENGVHAVPWTYLQVADTKDGVTQAEVVSGTRRPFGIRRQGRVEQVAIALRTDPADTTLRVRSRVAEDKPLVGYEVFALADPKKPESLERLGATDQDGRLAVPATENRIRQVLIKHGGHLLARLPVVPGAQAHIDVPLPDDDARLAAETRLAALREDLVDVVARRNILIARIRQKIKSKDYAGAQKLLGEVNDLPGRTQFNLELTNAARRLKSADPQIQRRIDQLFEGTQAALTQYLDVRPISEISNELRTAQQQKGS